MIVTGATINDSMCVVCGGRKMVRVTYLRDDCQHWETRGWEQSIQPEEQFVDARCQSCGLRYSHPSEYW